MTKGESAGEAKRERGEREANLNVVEALCLRLIVDPDLLRLAVGQRSDLGFRVVLRAPFQSSLISSMRMLIFA